MQILRPRELPHHMEGKYLLFLRLFLRGKIKGEHLLDGLKFCGRIRQFYDDLDNHFVKFNSVGFRGKIIKPAAFILSFAAPLQKV